MKTSTIVWVVVVLIIILGGAWWWSASQPAAAPAPASGAQGQTPPTSHTTVVPLLKVGSSAALGSFVTAQNGMTLYRFTKDTPGHSNCTGDCAAKWPPYTVAAGVPLAVSLNVGGTVGTIARADGSMQVTYNGTPLYYWYLDKQPGDTTGQNVGGVWFVVKP